MTPNPRSPASSHAPGASLKPAAVSISPAPLSGPSRPGRWLGLALAISGLVALGFLFKIRVVDTHQVASMAPAEFPLPPAEFEAPTAEGALEQLQGSWSTSDCSPKSGLGTSSVVVVVGGQISETKRVFSGSGCTNELYTLVLNKSITRLTSSSGSAVEVESALSDATVTANDPVALNQQAFLGATDWQLEAERSVLGALSSKIFGKELSPGVVTYDLLEVEGHRLLAAGGGEISLTPPTTIGQSAWTRAN